MKTRLFATLAAAAALWGAAFTSGNAQEPVSTGIVQGVSARAGTLTLRSDQTTRPITFYGMDRANIFTADGRASTVNDLTPGQQVTVQYAIRGKRWYISKVILPEARAAAPVAATNVYVDPALKTPAANDDDITTQPGSKAAVDNDITTVPETNRGGVRRRNP